MVDEEKTLLEQVREKEVALAAEYDRICAEAEAAREAAAQAGRATVEQAEQAGEDEARALYRQEMVGLEREIQRLQAEAAGQEEALRSAGESHVSRVADELVGYVAPASE